MRISDWSSDVCSSDLYEPCEDNEGSLSSRPVRDDDGNPVINREAVRRRDAMIERLAALPPVPGALAQIIQHFGPDAVAEVTGRRSEEHTSELQSLMRIPYARILLNNKHHTPQIN